MEARTKVDILEDIISIYSEYVDQIDMTQEDKDKIDSLDKELG